MNHHFSNPQKFKVAIIILVIIIVSLGSFRLGMTMGYHKAMFGTMWDKNYDRNFFGKREFMNSHGTIGTIIKIDNDIIAVSSREGKEQAVVITKDTLIKKEVDNVAITDLKIDDTVAIIGVPTPDGKIEAKLIRIIQKK